MTKDVKKTFADSGSSLLQELPECTEDAEMDLWLFKAATALSVARRVSEMFG